MISSRKTPQNESPVPTNQGPFPEDHSYGYTDEEVDAMNADHQAQKLEQLIHFIKTDVDAMLLAQALEPNDALLRASLKASIEDYLLNLENARDIDRFQVFCDEENNSQTRVNRNELYVDILIRPQGYSHDLSLVSKIGAMATVPVHQLQDDDEDDVLTIIGNAAGPGGGGGFVIGSGINASGVMSAGSGAYTMNGAQSIQSMVGQLTLDLTANQEPDLPAIVFNGYDYDEKKISMSLQPESTISTVEAFKIILLINAATHTPHKFSAFAYIKKNNLERHFKFAQ